MSPDTLVWREGWSDWRTAGPLFPSLSSETAEANPVDDEATEIKVETENETSFGRRATLPNRKPVRSRQKSVAAVITLTMVIMVLLVILVVVLQGL